MPRDFPDELLTAYLDGELSPDERTGVERHLASCEADRQLLDELRALRRDMATLPRANVKPGFADRVVQAAVAAKANSTAAIVPASSLRKRNGLILAAVVAGTAAVVLLFVRLRELPRGGVRPEVVQAADPVLTPAQRLIAALRASAPREGEAAVLRLRIPKQLAASAVLDAALTGAGIQQRSASDMTSGAIALGTAYQQQLATRMGADASTTVPAADALFVEAPFEQLERVFAALATDPNQAVELASELKLAFIVPPRRAEGEPGSFPDKTPGPAAWHPFAQRLQAEVFRLERRETCAVPDGLLATSPPDRSKAVRLLILVEQFDVKP